MVIAASTLTVLAFCVAGLVLAVLVGGGVRAFGRTAETMTEQGNKVRAEPPGFRRPPDEGGLL